MRLVFLGECADWAGRPGMNLKVAGRPRVAELLRSRTELKTLFSRRRVLKVAVNHEMASLAARVGNGDELAFMSPFGGG